MKKTLALIACLLLIMIGLGRTQSQENPAETPADAQTKDKTGTQTPEPPRPKDFVYHSSTSISLLLARGNNRTLTFSFDTDQNFVLKKDSLNFKGTMIYTKDNGFLTNEIYHTHVKYNHLLGEGAYVLGLVQFDRDTLAGYPSRYSFSAGGGCTWVKTTSLNFFSDLALGWSSENALTKVNLGDADGSAADKSINSSFLSTILTGRVTLNLTANSQVVQQGVLFVNMHDVSDYRVNSLSSLSASFSRYFGLKMSVQVNYDRKPVLGFKNTDVFLLSSLVIAI